MNAMKPWRFDWTDMPQPDHDKPQADKFRDLARELEADESEEAFEEKVRRIATAPKVEEPEK